MRPGNHLSIYLVIGLSAVFFVFHLISMPRDEVIPTLLGVGELWAIFAVLLYGFFTWRTLWPDKMGLPVRLALFALTGLAAGGIYWALTALGLSAKPARFIVWGILLAGFLGLHYLDLWREEKKPPPPA